MRLTDKPETEGHIVNSFINLPSELDRCCWVLMGIVSSNKQVELLETNKSGLLKVGGKIEWNGAQRADTSKIPWN